MRILHTADWHLGRLFHGVRLTDDQAHVLDDLCALVRDSKPDVLVIAGDVYDRAVPPPDAVELLNETLCRLVLECKTRVLLIAGNHDSPERLDYCSKLLERQGLVVAGRMTQEAAGMSIDDEQGTVRLIALPYAEPAVVRGFASDKESVRDHDTAMQARLSALRTAGALNTRTVLVAHALVLGALRSDSERALCIGGTEHVSSAVFDGAGYVALGHLHRPQAIGDGRIRYSGSLLKYSFSEADHTKSVALVEIDGSAAPRVELLPLRPRRDVRILEGTLEAILQAGEQDSGRNDYVLARLTDEGPVLDAMGKLRTCYPNALQIERTWLTSLLGGEQTSGDVADHRRLSERELFEAFMREAVGAPPTPDELKYVAQVIDELRAEQREASVAADAEAELDTEDARDALVATAS